MNEYKLNWEISREKNPSYAAPEGGAVVRILGVNREKNFSAGVTFERRFGDNRIHINAHISRTTEEMPEAPWPEITSEADIYFRLKEFRKVLEALDNYGYDDGQLTMDFIGDIFRFQLSHLGKDARNESCRYSDYKHSSHIRIIANLGHKGTEKLMRFLWWLIACRKKEEIRNG